MLYPFVFKPILKERIWGGRTLEQLYKKPLPPKVPIGESWEITDRPGDVSVIANGPLAGKDLRWLMEHHGRELLGNARSLNGRFPLLIKILDAREKLSLQVHPPASKASGLGGEPKTEMWYITDAGPTSELYVGLKQGVTREQFAGKIQDGTVADCFHRVPIRKGDAMFLPSGRVHAIGAELVIFEIQQNSDTTYRVFDWNRVGLHGKPRELHVPESMESIDFADFEPGLAGGAALEQGKLIKRELVSDPLFTVQSYSAEAPAEMELTTGTMQIIGVVEGSVILTAAQQTPLSPGQFCLVPAVAGKVTLSATKGAVFLLSAAG
jgi:mannose-6-phosphate isomerase